MFICVIWVLSESLSPFFSLQVCTNGAISLDKKYSKFTPKPFPLNTTDRAPLICPFWADANPSSGGNVFSRISRDPALLQQATAEGNRVRHEIPTKRYICYSFRNLYPYSGQHI